MLMPSEVLNEPADVCAIRFGAHEMNSNIAASWILIVLPLLQLPLIYSVRIIPRFNQPPETQSSNYRPVSP